MQDITLPSQRIAEKTAQAALAIVVNSPVSESQARAYLDTVDVAVKNLENDAEALKRPHLDFVAKVNALVKPLVTLLRDRRTELADKIIQYVEWCKAEAAKEQAKELKKYEAKVDRLEEKAARTGAPVPIVPPPPVIAQPPKTVISETGATQTIRVTKDWRLPTVVVDGQAVALEKDALTWEDAQRYGLKIPASFFYLNPGKVGQIVRAGGHVSGIEVVEVKGISVRKGA